MMWITAILLIGYGTALALLLFGFYRLHLPSQRSTVAVTAFSIVVPFRNEAENLARLWKSLAALEYPRDHFEIIFVDDASEDNSVAILEALGCNQPGSGSFRFRIMDNRRFSSSPKKDAITTAVGAAQHPWILTLDADCHVSSTLLSAYNEHIEASHSVMVCGPVRYHSNGSLLQRYQQFDGLSLQLVAMGGFGLQHPLLCNGANLAYLKSAFLEVGGYDGNNHIASGDDVFLLEKMRREFPRHISFLKSAAAIVTTQPQPSWRALIEQRIRWASKTTRQKNIAATLLGALVLSTNTLLLIGLPLLCFTPAVLFWWVPFLCIKLLIDILALLGVAGFFRTRIALVPLVLCSLLYPLVALGAVAGSSGGGYRWKGRTFKKPI